MRDSFDRKIDYLRISLTDKCNLMCKYCMPSEGVEHLSHCQILTLEEVYRLVAVMSELGIKRVRLTGGEPLVRKNICKLISDIKALPSIESISLTTNGVLLGDMISDLKSAGVDNVNISIDTLDRERYKELTAHDYLDKVLDSIKSALHHGLRPKLNCVPMKEWNEDELERIALMARDNDIDVRFIELMPTSQGKNYTPIPSDEIKKRFDKAFGEGEAITDESSLKGPAAYYKYDGFKGRIGFISPLSHMFCKDCNRIRLTSTGYLKLCLHHDIGLDLREIIRDGADDTELSEKIEEAIKLKPKAHNLHKPSGDEVSMYQIGG